MDALLWMFLPVFVAAGSALLSFYIMQARMEVAIAQERETIAQTRAMLSTHEQIMVDRLKATEEHAQRKSLDGFLADFRVEERHYVRESKSMFMQKKSMILQERLFFRNIPLSNWVEHEMVVEEGGDIQRLAKAASIFSTKSVEAQGAEGVPNHKLIGKA
jgi:hypothetical protein